MQPDALVAHDLGDGRDVVHRAGRRAAGGEVHHHRPQPRLDVLGDRGAQRVDVHRLRGGVDGDRADGVLAEAGHHRGLHQRRVGLRGPVDPPARVADAVTSYVSPAGAVQRGQQGGEGRGGGGVLDDAAARAVAAERLREPERLGEPVEHHLLDLGHRRARRPDHPLRTDAAGEEVAEDRGGRGVGREVGEEPRVLPVREAGHDDAVEVGQHGVERLGGLRCRRRQQASYVTGRDLRADGQVVEGGPVVGDPVDGGVPLAAELLGRHVGWLVGHGQNVLGTVECRVLNPDRVGLRLRRGPRADDG